MDLHVAVHWDDDDGEEEKEGMPDTAGCPPLEHTLARALVQVTRELDLQRNGEPMDPVTIVISHHRECIGVCRFIIITHDYIKVSDEMIELLLLQ